MSISESPVSSSAMAFFEACETGKGWDICKRWCHDDASFSCQADALAEITTLDSYSEWMKAMLGPIPDFNYDIRAFAIDQERNSVVVYGVGHGTQTGEGGPVPPTGKSVTADYVYVMEFNGDKIQHMTKIWNDGHSLKQMGWA
jgi:predicted ester cyclase